MGAKEAKIEEAIDLIAQMVKPLEVLPESDEEEDDGEQIAPVMSSFVDVFKEDEKDTTGTGLLLKAPTLPAQERLVRMGDNLNRLMQR
jgi:hypothetical protein